MTTDTLGRDSQTVCPLTTAAALRRAAVMAPDVEAVVDSSRRVTFLELEREVACIRTALDRARVQHGERVAICAGNSATWVALFLAIGAVGAVAVPINTRLKPAEIAYVLRQSRAQTLFIADRFLKIDFIRMLREVCPAIDTALPDNALPDLRQVVVLGEDVPGGASSWTAFMADSHGPTPASQCDPKDPLLIQYTSGTTAAPKGVLLTHRSLLANGFFAGTRVGLRSADRFHSARPFFHVAGTSQSILACLQHAATLVTMDRFEAGEALRLIEQERCTHFCANDTMALMLLDHPDRPLRKLSLRGAWLAASPAIAARVVEQLGARDAVLAYGQSEASPNVALSCHWEPPGVRISGRMRLQPGVEVRIRTPEGLQCATGETGEIQVRGWNVMLGYFDKPEETAAVLSSDGWLATGDLGSVDEEGRLRFVGRLKEMIRVGGENVAPVEIEDVLQRHSTVRQAQVVGVPHPRLVEVPAAFVVARAGSRCVEEELQQWCRAHLAGFKVPHHFVLVSGFESIGMTASAKIRKADLRAYAIRFFKLQV